MVLSTSAARAAEVENRLSYYQENIKSRDTGVYENDNVVYFQIKLPYGKGDRSDYKKLEATKLMHDMVRSWAIEYAMQQKQAHEPLSEGMAFARRIVSKYYPQWNYGAWLFRGKSQRVVPDSSSGFYTDGMIVEKGELVGQIPGGYYQDGSIEDLIKGMKTVVRTYTTKELRDKFLKACHVPDLLENREGISEDCAKNYALVEEKIADFMGCSEFVHKIREDQHRISSPHVETRIVNEQFNPTVSKTMHASCTTNMFEHVLFKTNVQVKCQGSKSIAERGLSEDGSVSETIVTGNLGEIVNVTTQIIVSTQRIVIQRESTSTVGAPAFETIFLNGFTNAAVAKSTTERGQMATATFGGKSTAVRKKTALRDALRENPYDKTLWNLYGRFLQNSGEKMGAIICYRRALSLDPQYDYALVNLGIVYKELGFGNLAHGLALLAGGLTDNDWVRDKAIEVLK